MLQWKNTSTMTVKCYWRYPGELVGVGINDEAEVWSVVV